MPIAIAIHYPKQQHLDEWADRMRQAGEASVAIPGLRGKIAGFRDTQSGRLVGLSDWDSMDALEAGIAGVKAKSDEADRAWGERQTDLLILDEI